MVAIQLIRLKSVIQVHLIVVRISFAGEAYIYAFAQQQQMRETF